MKRGKTESLSNILHQFLREEGIETPYNEYKAVAVWPEVVGETVAMATGSLQIKNNVLYAKINRPALRHELSLYHTQLTQNINARVGAQVIQDVHIY